MPKGLQGKRSPLRPLQRDALERKKENLRREVHIGLNDAVAGRFSDQTVAKISDEVWNEQFRG